MTFGELKLLVQVVCGSGAAGDLTVAFNQLQRTRFSDNSLWATDDSIVSDMLQHVDSWVLHLQQRVQGKVEPPLSMRSAYEYISRLQKGLGLSEVQSRLGRPEEIQQLINRLKLSRTLLSSTPGASSQTPRSGGGAAAAAAAAGAKHQQRSKRGSEREGTPHQPTQRGVKRARSSTAGISQQVQQQQQLQDAAAHNATRSQPSAAAAAATKARRTASVTAGAAARAAAARPPPARAGFAGAGTAGLTMTRLQQLLQDRYPGLKGGRGATAEACIAAMSMLAELAGFSAAWMHMQVSALLQEQHMQAFLVMLTDRVSSGRLQIKSASTYVSRLRCVLTLPEVQGQLGAAVLGGLRAQLQATRQRFKAAAAGAAAQEAAAGGGGGRGGVRNAHGSDSQSTDNAWEQQETRCAGSSSSCSQQAAW